MSDRESKAKTMRDLRQLMREWPIGTRDGREYVIGYEIVDRFDRAIGFGGRVQTRTGPDLPPPDVRRRLRRAFGTLIKRFPIGTRVVEKSTLRIVLRNGYSLSYLNGTACTVVGYTMVADFGADYVEYERTVFYPALIGRPYRGNLPCGAVYTLAEAQARIRRARAEGKALSNAFDAAESDFEAELAVARDLLLETGIIKDPRQLRGVISPGTKPDRPFRVRLGLTPASIEGVHTLLRLIDKGRRCRE